MPTILAADFLLDTRFTYLESLGLVTLQTLLDEAEADIIRLMPSVDWGDRYLRAIKLLAAHRATMTLHTQAGIAIAGNISSLNVSNGSQSASFGSGGGTDGDPEGLLSTTWGREFAAMRRGVPLVGVVI
jgi:hypothetical protein